MSHLPIGQTAPAGPSVETAVRRWQADLLDLSHRNRLIYFRPNQALSLSQPSPAGLYSALVTDRQTFTVYRPARELPDLQEADLENPPALVPTASPPPVSSRPPRADEVVIDGDPRRTAAALYRLRLRARSALQEQGISVLFVSFGILEWRESDANPELVQSPLLLVPVVLERETALAPFTMTMLDEGPTINPALAHFLKRTYNLNLEVPDVPDNDDSTLGFLLDHFRQLTSGQASWRISPAVHLGLFSFAKYAMYADLETIQSRIVKHPIVRSLAGVVDGSGDVTVDLPSADRLDRTLHPTNSSHVLDADASQLEAIAAVAAGVSLVIQGPPGTGKSQTITNIIAEALAGGKTVLFVSEKMAALRVVAKRLAEAGLQDFCLEAHSQDVDKALVIRELERALRADRVAPETDHNYELDQLHLLRTQLNDYVQALHDRDNPLGISAYRAHGEIALRTAAPVLVFDPPDVPGLTQARLAEVMDVVERLARVGQVILVGTEHPWWGCTLGRYAPEVSTLLESQFGRVAATTSALHSVQAPIRAQLGLEPHSSLESARWLIQLLVLLQERQEVPAHWLLGDSLATLRTTAADYQQRLAAYWHQRTDLLSRFDEAVFALDLDRLRATLHEGAGAYERLLRAEGDPTDRALELRSALEPTLRRWLAAIAALAAAIPGAAEPIGVPSPTTLDGAVALSVLLRNVLSDPCPLPTWLEASANTQFQDLAADAEREQLALDEAETILAAQFEPQFLTVATEELSLRFERDYASFWRWFRPSYRRDIQQLRRLAKEPGKLDYRAATAALTLAQRRSAAMSWLAEHRESCQLAFGSHYDGHRTNWSAIRQALAAVRDISQAVGSALPAPLQALLFSRPGAVNVLQPTSHRLSAAVTETELARQALLEFIETGPMQHVGLDSLTRAFEEMLARLQAFWAAADLARAHYTGSSVTARDLTAGLDQAHGVRAHEAELATASRHLHDRYGERFAGLNTDWAAILAALSWAERLLVHVGPPPPTFVEVIVRGNPVAATEASRLELLTQDMEAAVEELRPVFSPSAYTAGDRPLDHATAEAVIAWARGKLTTLPELEDWIDAAQAMRMASEAGLGTLCDALIRERPPVEHWRDAVLRQLYTRWLSWRHDQSPLLAAFRGQHHDALVARFRELDRRQWSAATRRIVAAQAKRKPAVTVTINPNSEPGILLREASKRRRFRPLRRLFADLPHLLPTLKPCLLMSPLSVARYLGDSPITFDLVVFDEASQILPADAVGAMARARQLVVVGDQQQLPPTTFFATGAATEEEDSDDDLPESILDSCAARLPTKRLLWHYRSRHEHLIAPSNKWFYDNELITFPSPDHEQRAVRFEHIASGVYERGTRRVNPVEAQAIVDRVVEQVRAHPEKSIGVITFSEPQMEIITRALDRRKSETPDLERLLDERGPEGFFVKNIENVQGDERDVIFFSVGYGPDESGQLSMNFGPLNRRGGERRLNVAITRARERVLIMASFRPHAIDLAKTSARGIHLLRRYLEYAEGGPDVLETGTATPQERPIAPFESAVATALAARGLKISSQVGVGSFRIDLGVKDSSTDHYILGIECDGRAYREARTARDRDRLRHQVLEQLGWSVHRIWSNEWIKAPSRECDRVMAVVEAVRQGVTVPSPAAVAPTARERETSSRPAPPPAPPTRTAEPAPPVALPYTVASLAVIGDQEQFASARLPQLAALVAAVVNTESPVLADRVMRQVAAAYGIGRLGSRVRARLTTAIEHATRAGTVVARGHFLWSPRMSAPTVRGAAADGWMRGIEEIAPEELAVALIGVLQHSFSMGRDHVITAAARLIGFDRTGAKVEAAFDAVIDDLLRDGRLASSGDQLRVVPPTVEQP